VREREREIVWAFRSVYGSERHCTVPHILENDSLFWHLLVVKFQNKNLQSAGTVEKSLRGALVNFWNDSDVHTVLSEFLSFHFF